MKKLLLIGLLFGVLACSKDADTTAPTAQNTAPPTAATLTAPADKELCLGANKLNSTYSEVTFEWQAAKNVNGYDLTITNLNTNVSQTKYTTQTKLDVVLESGMPYSWFITSKSPSSTEKVNSSVWKFYLSGNGNSNLAPYPADGLVPKSGATVTLIDGKVNLSWVGQDPDTNVNALSYEVFIDTDPVKVAKQEVQAVKVTNNFVTVSLSPGKIYYWMIKTSDNNLSSFTQVFSFRTP